MSKSTKKKKFISLNLKMTGMIMIGIVLALLVFAFCSYVESTVANKFYLSKVATEKSAGEAYGSLEKFIRENNVKASDSTALSEWLKTRDYTYLFVYDNYENVFEAGWWVDDAKETTDPLQDEDTTVYDNTNQNENKRITRDSFQTDANNRIVNFADGEYYVYMKYYGEERLYSIMSIVKVILCFLTLLTTLLVYNGQLIKRVIKLSGSVKDIGNGELKKEISPEHNDEIGQLASGVDDMRNAIIQRLESEKEAWDANTQLITSMSHDIRTPLTSLIGYLDIIEGKKYADEEEFEKFISSSRDKAFQLKDLSDKLFQYFLVFGSPEVDREYEVLDAGILFQQLLIEHVAEAVSYGYKVDLNYTVPEINVKMDVSGIRRLFDNLFSNIMKYAEKTAPIEIKAYYKDDSVHILFRNRIAEHAKKVESTRIGVKTCERICTELGGTFMAMEDDEYYRSNISFPEDHSVSENVEDDAFTEDGQIKE